VPTDETTWVQRLQDVGMLSDFYPGILVAWQLEGVKFALGPSISTTRSYLREFGGYASIENKPADDLLIGRLIAEQGREVVLLPYAIFTVPDYQSLRELFLKRLRWITVMRHMRPWGHLGLVFTLGLPWALLALVIQPSSRVAAGYLGGYLLARSVLTLLVGQTGLKQSGVWAKLLYIPLWDAMATAIWLASFARRTIRWRGHDYAIVNGELIPSGSTD
jgi:ceramide glucosyltransferase